MDATVSYDVHIVRTDDWFSAEENPITQEDVESLVRSDPDLSWSETDFVDLRASNGTVQRHYGIVWRGVPAFYHDKGKITCSGPDESQVMKMVNMAGRLGARVVGDEGEQYLITRDAAGNETLRTEPAE